MLKRALIPVLAVVFIAFHGCTDEQESFEQENKTGAMLMESVPATFQDPGNPLNIGKNHNFWLDEKISQWEIDNEPETWDEAVSRIENYLEFAISRDIDISGASMNAIVDLSMKILDSLDMQYQGSFNFYEKWFSFDHNRYDELIDLGIINNAEKQLLEDAFTYFNALPENATNTQIEGFIVNMDVLLDEWESLNFNLNEGEGWVSAAFITTARETSQYWIEEDYYSGDEPKGLIAWDAGGAVAGAVGTAIWSYYDNGTIDWADVGVGALAGGVGGTTGGAVRRAFELIAL